MLILCDFGFSDKAAFFDKIKTLQPFWTPHSFFIISVVARKLSVHSEIDEKWTQDIIKCNNKPEQEIKRVFKEKKRVI